MTQISTNNDFQITGDMNFERASQIFSAIDFSAIEEPQITIDLSAVEQSDSAALAVMLEWTNQANKNNKQVSFSHVPPQLMNLIKLAELEKILKLVPQT